MTSPSFSSSTVPSPEQVSRTTLTVDPHDQTGRRQIAAEGPVILFDGLCHFCSGTVQFVLARDPDRRFLFAPLQSRAGQELQRRFGISYVGPETIVLVEGGRSWLRSSAVLRIARGMSGLWPLLYVFIAVPRPLRDLVYGFVARNRYRWFGRRDQCFVPSPEERSRFLDEPPDADP